MFMLGRFAYNILAVGVLTISPLIAHPGALDSNGGHKDKRTGQYHHHKATSQQQQDHPTGHATSDSPRKSTTPPTTAQGAEIDRLVQEYFRSANTGLANKPIGVTHERNVSEQTKSKVIARDGGHCVTCGSTRQLEVDHKVALMNGGTNEESNLATLCDDCHTKKTRMDGSLRRNREKLQRKGHNGQ